MMFTRIYIFCFLLICIATSSHAALPPLSEAELDRHANVIVQAKVLATKKLSTVQLNSCTRRTEFVSTLQLLKRIKGPVGELKFNVHYFHYTLARGCVGPQGIYVARGERGKFYLRCNATLSSCSIIQPNGFLRSGS